MSKDNKRKRLFFNSLSPTRSVMSSIFIDIRLKYIKRDIKIYNKYKFKIKTSN